MNSGDSVRDSPQGPNTERRSYAAVVAGSSEVPNGQNTSQSVPDRQPCSAIHIHDKQGAGMLLPRSYGVRGCPAPLFYASLGRHIGNRSQTNWTT